MLYVRLLLIIRILHIMFYYTRQYRVFVYHFIVYTQPTGHTFGTILSQLIITPIYSNIIF